MELSANLPKHRLTPHHWVTRLNWDTDARPRPHVSGYFSKLTFFSVFDNFAYTYAWPCVRGRLSDRRFSAKAFSTEIMESKSTSFFIHIKNATFRVNFAIGQERVSLTSMENRRYFVRLFGRTKHGSVERETRTAGKGAEKNFLAFPLRVSRTPRSLCARLRSTEKRKKITPVQLSNHSPVTIILYCLSLMKNHYCTRVFNTCKTFKQTNVYKFIDHNLSL